MARSVVREAMAGEVQRFFADAMEKAGGATAVALALHEMGFEGRGEGPLDERTIRTWAAGTRMPQPDVVFAVATQYGLSIDRYAFSASLVDELMAVKRRLDALEADGKRDR